MSLLFNRLPRFVIAFLPRSKRLKLKLHGLSHASNLGSDLVHWENLEGAGGEGGGRGDWDGEHM